MRHVRPLQCASAGAPPLRRLLSPLKLDITLKKELQLLVTEEMMSP